MPTTKQSNSESVESNNYFNKEFWIKIAFVAISALLWFSTKLSQDDYTDNLQYKIEFQDQKKGKVISDVSVDAFNIELEGNGYDLLSVNTSFQNSIVLSLDEADKIDEAKKLGHEGLKIAKKYGHKLKIIRGYDLLTRIYEKEKDYKNALINYKEYKSYNDSISKKDYQSGFSKYSLDTQLNIPSTMSMPWEVLMKQRLNFLILFHQNHQKIWNH